MAHELSVALGGMSFHHVLLAFAGGMFATAFGTIPVFVIVGVIMLCGAATMAAGGPPAFLFNVGFSYGTGFMIYGGACAAAAYAGRKGYIASGRDLATPLMGLKRPDVLLVGGLFGIIAATLYWLIQTVFPLKINGYMWTDAMAIALTITTIIARLVFGKTGLFGKVPEGKSRFKFEGEHVWVPWQQSFMELLLIGIAAGFASSYVAMMMGAKGGGAFICFGFSLVSLVFLQFGAMIPVTHHITLVAALAALASGSVLWGGIFGIVTAFLGQFFAGAFLVYGDTHIDPPAFAIAAMASLISLFNAFGLFALMPLA